MNQNTRTLIFVGVAVLAAIGAWATAPSAARVVPDDVVNQPIAPDFKDPLLARSMEIQEFDEKTGDPKVFKVEEQNGIWSLPSKYGYPADAERQLGEAAANLMHLTKLGVVSNEARDHALFGVVDPETAKVGATGVGKRITLTGEGGKPLLDIIVGKEVKDQPDQRYVRIPGRDAVYPVKINISKLSTKFEDWIEKDLLKVSGWDIVEVIQNNYSVDRVQGSVKQGEMVDLKYDDKQSKWSMEGLQPGEELDAARLNELKSALDDLKIVDVRRKPAGLSGELRRAEGIELDQQAILSLASKGFYLTQDGNLLSNEGEVIVHTKDGIEYVLRFGDIAADTEGGDADQPADAADAAKAAEGDAAGDAPPKTGANRYIFVTARFDESLIPKPDADQPAATPAAAAPPAAETPAAEPPPAATPAEPASETPAEKPAEATATPEGAGGDDAGQEPAPAAAEAAPAAAETKSQPAADARPADKPAGDAPPADAKAGPAAPADDPQQKAAEAERQRKQSEYDDKLKKGQERVKELNNRFADWYYVIPDDVYKKIHLTRADVLKKPEPAKTDAPKSPEEQLQDLQGGLKAPEGTTPPTP